MNDEGQRTGSNNPLRRLSKARSSRHHHSSFSHLLSPLVLCLSSIALRPSPFVFRPLSFVLRPSSIALCLSPFVFRPSSFVLRPLSFVTRRSSPMRARLPRGVSSRAPGPICPVSRLLSAKDLLSDSHAFGYTTLQPPSPTGDPSRSIRESRSMGGQALWMTRYARLMRTG